MDRIELLRQLHDSKQLEPFIRHIRFPHYKNLVPNTRIEFTFPLTALVGPNGTNKSSVLRALFGAPGRNNLGNFWFSTKVDPIEDSGDRPRFIYGYFNPNPGKVVEVIKTRIHKKDKPDYWEPSRPLIKDSMEPMPAPQDGTDKALGRSATRWDNIEKEVVYVDFRSEISAYDKFFYHSDLVQTVTVRTKQDFIRSRSHYLRRVIDENLTSYMRFNKERVRENRLLSKDETKAVGAMLQREYGSIRLVRHGFFKQEGHSVILQHLDRTYSEAFAGSGEFAAAMLVLRVWNAPERSLILLDEPEVSLHPGAQERLIAFLYDQIKRKKHQIVLSTHSPTLVRDLPPDAIKVFHFGRVTREVSVQQQSMAEEAFFHLGEPVPGRIRVLVEDRLGAELVKVAIRPLGEAIASMLQIDYFPGGAKTLYTHYIPVFAAEQRSDTLVLLDGDQRPDKLFADPLTIPESENESLGTHIKQFTGVDVKFPVDGGADGGNAAQLASARKRFIGWVRANLDFLPDNTPETFVWSNMKKDKLSDSVESLDAKKRFGELTRLELGYATFEQATAEDIFQTQKRRLATIPQNDSGIEHLRKVVHAFVGTASLGKV